MPASLSCGGTIGRKSKIVRFDTAFRRDGSAHAITVLPAVSSLKALRRVGKPSAAQRPMIGFANPLLDGPDARYANRAKLAHDRQRCPEGRRQRWRPSLDLVKEHRRSRHEEA
jgi:hypothetical protein